MHQSTTTQFACILTNNDRANVDISVQNGNTNIGAIVGGVIGGLVAVVLIIIIVIFIIKEERGKIS